MRILNLTQHNATEAQKEAGVYDLPETDRRTLTSLLTFDEIPTHRDMIKRAGEITSIAEKYAPSRIVMIGGAPFFMHYLAETLSARNILPKYAFSKRRTQEETLPDGTVKKTMTFVHEGFVDIL